MIRTIRIFLFVFLLAIALDLAAQQSATNKKGAKTTEKTPAKSTGTHKFFVIPRTYIGGTYSGGPITKIEFDQLLKKGFTAHDTLGNNYRIVGFDFTYAERNLYEDSIGNLQVLVDYLNEYCPGDTVSTGISNSIYDRIKPGDTVFIDHVQLRALPGNTLFSPGDSLALSGKGMKCVIVK
jgi:hypothetical protein